jgi:hypothetical protein
LRVSETVSTAIFSGTNSLFSSIPGMDTPYTNRYPSAEGASQRAPARNGGPDDGLGEPSKSAICRLGA